MGTPATNGRVLVVDDDASVRALLVRFLAIDGYEVDEAGDGVEALASVEKNPPDLVLLDLTLPAEDGLDVLGRLRSRSDLPVILLTGRAEEADRVMGLKLGADDYVVKPFSPAELSARITSVLRRTRSSGPRTRFEFKGLSVDASTREVAVDGEIVPTTAKEFALLLFLVSQPRQVFSRQQLLSNVWESSSEWQDPATVTEHVRRLRHKIEADADHPRWIITVRGVGYRFEPSGAA